MTEQEIRDKVVLVGLNSPVLGRDESMDELSASGFVEKFRYTDER